MKFAIGMWLALAAFAQAAGLEFDQLVKEITAPADANTVVADFNFTNKSDKPITITKADPGCTCLKVQISGGKLKYAPGESGVVRTTFDMGNFSGTVDKVLPLYLDNAPESSPSLKLTLRVNIPVLIGLDQKTLKWELGGKAEPQTIHIVMAEGQTIRVTGTKSSSPSFACEVKTVEEGKKYDLIVTPLEIDTVGMTVIRIETDCPLTKHKIQQAFAVVRKATAAEVAAKP